MTKEEEIIKLKSEIDLLRNALEELEYFASYVAFNNKEADWGRVINLARDAMLQTGGFSK